MYVEYRGCSRLIEHIVIKYSFINISFAYLSATYLFIFDILSTGENTLFKHPMFEFSFLFPCQPHSYSIALSNYFSLPSDSCLPVIGIAAIKTKFLHL
jgi:hypothetical protein